MIALPGFPWPDPLLLAEQLLHIQGHALLTKEALEAHADFGEISLGSPGAAIPASPHPHRHAHAHGSGLKAEGDG
jgi:hypothetical protein